MFGKITTTSQNSFKRFSGSFGWPTIKSLSLYLWVSGGNIPLCLESTSVRAHEKVTTQVEQDGAAKGMAMAEEGLLDLWSEAHINFSHS